MTRKNRKPKVLVVTTSKAAPKPRPRVRRNRSKTSRSTEERTAMEQYRSQLLHPFETQVLTRGPFSGQPTGLFTVTQEVVLNLYVGNQGWGGIIMTPYLQTVAAVWNPTGIVGNVVAGDFYSVAANNYASVISNYSAWRPLAGAVKLINSTNLLNSMGVVRAGTFSPGQKIIGASYNALLSYSNFTTCPANSPVEALYLPDTGIGQQGGEYRALTSTNLTTVLSDGFYGNPCIFITGLDTSKAYSFAFRIRWIMEALPTGTQDGVITCQSTSLTTDDWQRICMQLPHTTGSSLVRQGLDALVDRNVEMKSPEEEGYSYIPSMAGVFGAAASMAATNFVRGNRNTGPILPVRHGAPAA